MEQSGKRHLLLTGTRGAGKTTLLNALTPKKLPGITTKAIPKDSVWMEDNLTGERFPVGRFDPSLPGPENRMRPISENLEIRGVALLRACMESDSPWVSMDEIGYLESGCPACQQALLELMERKRLLAVVRKQDLPFLQSLLRREDVCAVDLDQPFGNLGCVIMASGLGRRFGGNKLMADFLGRPLICRVLDATEGVFAKRVVVTRHEAVAELCREREIPVVLHDLPDRNDTVRLGLEQMEGMDGCLFCPGDQPLLRRETVELMALCADGKQMWRLAFGGQAGSPMLFPKRLFPELMALPKGKGGGVLAKKYPRQVQTVPAREEQELWDADTPEDLEKLKALSF